MLAGPGRADGRLISRPSGVGVEQGRNTGCVRTVSTESKTAERHPNIPRECIICPMPTILKTGACSRS